MKKIVAIAWKDTSIRFRDRSGLLLMIIAPLILAAIIGASFGQFLLGNSTTPFDAIPVAVINQDSGDMGQQFVDALQSEQLTDLLLLTVAAAADETAVRTQVQQGDIRALIIIPANFTNAVMSSEDSTSIQFYADPGATLTPNIVRGIVLQIMNQFNSGAVAAAVTVDQLLPHSRDLGPAMLELEPTLTSAISEQTSNGRITLNPITVGIAAEKPIVEASPFAFFAPSMGILFLMFAMMDTTRTILEEERDGTLGRLLTTPSGHMQILLGKVTGILTTGFIQFIVFVFASRILFQLDWGSSPAGLGLMVIGIVLAYTSLGMVIAAYAKDLNQAAIIGSVLSLVFAALGGNFVAAQNFPPFLNQLSKITINRWGLDGLTELTIYQGGMSDVLPHTAVLLTFSAIMLTAALWQFNRRIRR